MSDQVDTLQLHPKTRQDALENFALLLSEWQMAMPDVEPLLMDFGLGDFYRTGLIECWLANEIEAGYCAKYLSVFDGQQSPSHSHQFKHETFHIVKGTVQLIVDGDEHMLNEGDILAMPPGKVHSFTGLGPALILEISTPCLVDDNVFEDPAVAQWIADALG